MLENLLNLIPALLPTTMQFLAGIPIPPQNLSSLSSPTVSHVDREEPRAYRSSPAIEPRPSQSPLPPLRNEAATLPEFRGRRMAYNFLHMNLADDQNGLLVPLAIFAIGLFCKNWSFGPPLEGGF
jgi:hypothetical protein